MASTFGERTRRSKLTPRFIKEAAKLVAAGNYPTVVARAMGIHRSTWTEWMKAGEHAPDDDPRAKLFKAVEAAQANAEVNRVKVVAEASETDARFATWWLERTAPERWARREEVKIDAKFQLFDELQRKVAALFPDPKEGAIDAEFEVKADPQLPPATEADAA